jgi:hypothetical protein
VTVLSLIAWRCICTYSAHFDSNEALSTTGIPFETEAQLRERGTAKTPDILLSLPLGVETLKKSGEGTEWKVVCWIDSKVSKCSN